MMYPYRLLSVAILSVNSLNFWCEQFDIKHPDIVIKQAMLESGHMRCNNCALSEHNNLFGFQDSNGYLKFSHWSLSVQYYANFQKKYYKGGDYYDFLRRSWGCPNVEKYIETLKRIKL